MPINCRTINNIQYVINNSDFYLGFKNILGDCSLKKHLVDYIYIFSGESTVMISILENEHKKNYKMN